jgi:hypothetical protein
MYMINTSITTKNFSHEISKAHITYQKKCCRLCGRFFCFGYRIQRKNMKILICITDIKQWFTVYFVSIYSAYMILPSPSRCLKSNLRERELHFWFGSIWTKFFENLNIAIFLYVNTTSQKSCHFKFQLKTVIWPSNICSKLVQIKDVVSISECNKAW